MVPRAGTHARRGARPVRRLAGLSAGAPTDPVEIAVRDLAVTYPRALAAAVQDVSFELPAGASLLIAGPSGSGKSTLARAIAGLIPWAVPGRLEGSIHLDDLVVGSADPRALVARVGTVFQDPASQLVMERAGDDVAFGLEGRAWPRERMRVRVPAALTQAGLAGFDQRRTTRLSGGEQQRLALAGAFAPEPGLLVLDEPTANLDPAGAVDFAARLAELRVARSATLVLVEHRADLAWPLADLVLALGTDGRPIAFGTPADLLEHRRAELVGAGIWLPGEPMPVPHCAVREGAAGAPGLLTADRVTFGFEPGRPVIQEVSMSVAPGERVALLGPNGSGKSTFARLLVGLLRPATGSIRLAGRDPGRCAARDLVRLAGYVVQDPERSFLTATVADELRLGLPSEALARADEVATRLFLPLARFGSRNPFTLSGGEQRRLSLAAQLVRRPALLVLDEPTFGQDRRGFDGLVALLREHVDAGTAVLSVTHDLRFAMEMADRTLRMTAGRIEPAAHDLDPGPWPDAAAPVETPA